MAIKKKKVIAITSAGLFALVAFVLWAAYVSHINNYHDVRCVECTRISRYIQRTQHWEDILYSAKTAHQSAVFLCDMTFDEVIAVVSSWLPWACNSCVISHAQELQLVSP